MFKFIVEGPDMTYMSVADPGGGGGAHPAHAPPYNSQRDPDVISLSQLEQQIL